MRRRLIPMIAGVAALLAAPIGAEAATRSFWDQSKGEWVRYEVTGATGSQRYSRVPSGSGISGPNTGTIRRQLVNYDGPFLPNTIVVNTAERRLYLVVDKGKAWKYGIGVGREGFQWSGANYVSRKAEWPGWTPPPEMIARERAKGRILPAYMKGGPDNPLGARAMYIGDTLYRIHGSNEPWSIGRAVSSGCIRLVNEDVTDLYNKVRIGTRVVVLTGRESATQLAALARPPAPKKPTAVADRRTKDDDATALLPFAPAMASAPEDRPIKDDQASIIRPSADEVEPVAEPETDGDDQASVALPQTEAVAN